MNEHEHESPVIIGADNPENIVLHIQSYLGEHGLDGWLVYDYNGLNPVSPLFLEAAHHFATRRWFYFIPCQGTPVYLLHAIEKDLPRTFPGQVMLYSSWQDFFEKLSDVLTGRTRIALEYSPRCSLPAISRVDAGTLEIIKELGIEPVSSAELVQFFTCRLSEAQVKSHKQASKDLYAIRDIILENLRQDLIKGYCPNEYQIQQRYLEQFELFGLETEFPPIVAVNENTGNPHYQPEADRCQTLRPGSVLLLDTWARQKAAGSVYSDITWMAYLGDTIPEQVQNVFEVVISARDAVLEKLEARFRAGRPIRGYEADDIARNVINLAGYGDYFTHRTGHNLGGDVHGAGANLDNLETHEERDLIPGTAFTVEPGIYLADFGIRSEINVYYDPVAGFQITTPPQRQITKIMLL